MDKTVEPASWKPARADGPWRSPKLRGTRRAEPIVARNRCGSTRRSNIFRTSGLPTVRLQASRTLQFGAEPSVRPPGLRPTPPCAARFPRLLRPWRSTPATRVSPPLRAAPRLRPRHLRPEALAPSGFCCRALTRLPTSSASQEDSLPFPGTAGYPTGPAQIRTCSLEHPEPRSACDGTPFGAAVTPPAPVTRPARW